MDWQGLLALAGDDVPLTLTLTPLERNIVLAVFSSTGTDAFDGFADESERQDAQDALDRIKYKLMEWVT